MLALTQENVHYTLNSGPETGFMRWSRILNQAGGGGGGGGVQVEARRPEKSLDNVFLDINLFYRVDPMVLLERGGGGPTSSRGVQRKPYNL